MYSQTHSRPSATYQQNLQNNYNQYPAPAEPTHYYPEQKTVAQSTHYAHDPYQQRAQKPVNHQQNYCAQTYHANHPRPCNDRVRTWQRQAPEAPMYSSFASHKPQQAVQQQPRHFYPAPTHKQNSNYMCGASDTVEVQSNGSSRNSFSTEGQSQGSDEGMHLPMHQLVAPRCMDSASTGDEVENVHGALSAYMVQYVPLTELGTHFGENNQSSDVNTSMSVATAKCNFRGPTVRLFVGQVLHEVSAAQLLRLFSVLCSVTVLKAEIHGPGCFFITIPAVHARNARLLHGRVLFDVKGVWYAKSADQAQDLHNYMSTVRKQLKDKHVPRSTLVVRR